MAPADLATFWTDTIQELARTPMNPSLEEVPEQSSRDFTTHRLTMDSYQGKRIRGWFSVPKDTPPGGKLPAILAVPGYGGGKAIPTHLVVSGFAVLTLYPRAQGESLNEWKLDHGTKLTYHVTDKDKYYYRVLPRRVYGLPARIGLFVLPTPGRRRPAGDVEPQPRRRIHLGHRFVGQPPAGGSGRRTVFVQLPGVGQNHN